MARTLALPLQASMTTSAQTCNVMALMCCLAFRHRLHGSQSVNIRFKTGPRVTWVNCALKAHTQAGAVSCCDHGQCVLIRRQWTPQAIKTVKTVKTGVYSYGCPSGVHSTRLLVLGVLQGVFLHLSHLCSMSDLKTGSRCSSSRHACMHARTHNISGPVTGQQAAGDQSANQSSDQVKLAWIACVLAERQMGSRPLCTMATCWPPFT